MCLLFNLQNSWPIYTLRTNFMPLDVPSHVTLLHKFLTTCNNNMTHVGAATVLSKETKPINVITNLHFKPFKIWLWIMHDLWLTSTQTHTRHHNGITLKITLNICTFLLFKFFLIPSVCPIAPPFTNTHDGTCTTVWIGSDLAPLRVITVSKE